MERRTFFFYGKRPLGVNKIRSLMQEGARILGLPTTFKPHSLRALCITRLSNDESVSLAETMSIARHSSVSASKTYQTLNGHSEHNRLRALGVPVEKLVVQASPRPTPEDSKSFEGAPTDEASDLPGLTKRNVEVEEAEAEVEVFSSSDSESENSIKIGSHRLSNNDVSLTQVGIDHLKEDIGDLKAMLKQKPPPKPQMSENQRQIMELSNVVQGLKKELIEKNHDRLYYESLAEDHVREIDQLKFELRSYKISEEEEVESTRRSFRNDEIRRSRGAFKTWGAGEYTKNRRRNMDDDRNSFF